MSIPNKKGSRPAVNRAEPYTLEERSGAPEGDAATLAIVYEHRAADAAGKYAKVDVYVVRSIPPERREGVERSLRTMTRIGNEGFQNGWNLREFQMKLDSALPQPSLPAMVM